VGSETAFREAVKVAHDSRPETIYTDALRSYGEAISLWPDPVSPPWAWD
jgi:hypothetical protein